MAAGELWRHGTSSGVAHLWLLSVFLSRVCLALPGNCSQQMPAGCKLYNLTSKDCQPRYEVLNNVTDNVFSYPQAVNNLCVRPVEDAVADSLFISWEAPQNWQEQWPRGVKLLTTALDDAARSSLCWLFDFSEVPSDQWSFEGTMSYSLLLPHMPGMYSWEVQVESLPSSSNANQSASIAYKIVTTDPGSRETCSVAVAPGHTWINVTFTMGMYLMKEAVMPNDVILHHYDAGECCDPCSHTHRYKVILYQCEAEEKQCCDDDCYYDMSEVDSRILTSTSPLSVFEEIPPGMYWVWVYPAENELHVCSRTAVLTFPRSTKTAHSISLPDDVNRKSSISIIVLVVVTVCACALGGVIGFIWWRRKSRSRSLMVNISCLEKLMECETSRSTENGIGEELCAMSVLPAEKRLVSRLVVCLISADSSLHKAHRRAIDSLALYLQAFCSCDMTYFRWHLDNFRFVCPERWIVEQMNRADCIVFVHSPETKDCFESWKAEQLLSRETNLANRILASVFGQVCEGQLSSSRWFHVTFQPDLTLADVEGIFPRSSSQSAIQAQKAVYAEENNICGTSFGGVNSARFSSTGFRLYCLMEDFTRFLADLHSLPCISRVFQENNLPVDSDHLDTQEGRELHNAVACLRQGFKLARREMASTASCSSRRRVQLMDSGFDSISFISPDGVSVADTETGSLGEMFWAVNSRYEANCDDGTSV